MLVITEAATVTVANNNHGAVTVVTACIVPAVKSYIIFQVPSANVNSVSATDTLLWLYAILPQYTLITLSQLPRCSTVQKSSMF